MNKPDFDTTDPSESENGQYLAKTSLAALGVVYGDIGTSPLYAVHQCFFGSVPLAVTSEHVLGVLSLIFWALILIISVKYLLIVMRADNHGEGGILALLALLDPWHNKRSQAMSSTLIILGIFGAALLFGDGMITPAISVLSAVEGLKVAAPDMTHFVVPLTVVILAWLFWLQKRGTQQIGSLFGPIMIIWFITIGILGLVSIMNNIHVLAAINPFYAWQFCQHHPTAAFLVLGGVFLVVTGGEALYADMGHFGAKPIQLAWFVLVLPCLLLNYFGQGAYILGNPASVTHPFYNLVPGWGVFPMIGLATIVTVIASQAVISGTFSLTRQAIQLQQSPRLRVIQTSSEEIGQIYVPLMNLALMTGSIALVIGFGSSVALAAAYGVAVSATMVITTILAYFVMREHWQWPVLMAITICAVFLSIDLLFFSANLSKVVDGGWFPLLVAGITMLLMTTWTKGRKLLNERIDTRSMSVQLLTEKLDESSSVRVTGTGIFLSPPGEKLPAGLLHHLKLNKVLHETIILITSITEDVPRVPASQRLKVNYLGNRFYRIYLYYGFMQSPNIPVALKLGQEQELIPDVDQETFAYYADRITLIASSELPGMAYWRKLLYIFMVRNSQRAVDYYNLPPGKSVELGLQVEI